MSKKTLGLEQFHKKYTSFGLLIPQSFHFCFSGQITTTAPGGFIRNHPGQKARPMRFYNLTRCVLVKVMLDFSDGKSLGDTVSTAGTRSFGMALQEHLF